MSYFLLYIYTYAYVIFHFISTSTYPKRGCSGSACDVRKDLESQVAFLERRLIERTLSAQEAEMQMQQDARMRHQVAQERCSALATEMASAEASEAMKRLALQESQAELRAELLAAQQATELQRRADAVAAQAAQEEFGAAADVAARRTQALLRRAEEAERRQAEAEEAARKQCEVTSGPNCFRHYNEII